MSNQLRSRCPHHNAAIIATVDCLGEQVPLCCWLEMTRGGDPRKVCGGLKDEKRKRRK